MNILDEMADKPVCDLPDAEFTLGGSLDRLARAAGYASGRAFVNDSGLWAVTVGEVLEILKGDTKATPEPGPEWVLDFENETGLLYKRSGWQGHAPNRIFFTPWERYFAPSRRYIGNSAIETEIKYYQWTKRHGVWVYFTDGTRFKSDLDLRDLKAGTDSVVQISKEQIQMLPLWK